MRRSYLLQRVQHLDVAQNTWGEMRRALACGLWVGSKDAALPQGHPVGTFIELAHFDGAEPCCSPLIRRRAKSQAANQEHSRSIKDTDA